MVFVLQYRIQTPLNQLGSIEIHRARAMVLLGRPRRFWRHCPQASYPPGEELDRRNTGTDDAHAQLQDTQKIQDHDVSCPVDRGLKQKAENSAIVYVSAYFRCSSGYASAFGTTYTVATVVPTAMPPIERMHTIWTFFCQDRLSDHARKIGSTRMKKSVAMLRTEMLMKMMPWSKHCLS